MREINMITKSKKGTARKMAAYVIGITAATIPLWMNLCMDDSFDLPKLTIMVLATTIAGWLLWLDWAGSKSNLTIKRSPLDLPILMCLGALGCSTYLSVDPALSLWGMYRIYTFGLIPCVFAAVFFWIALQVLDSADLRWLKPLLIAAGVLVMIYTLLQYMGWEPFLRMPKAPGGRIWATLGNPIYLGAYLMMILLLVLPEHLFSPRWSSWILVLLLLFALLLTLSRSAWVGTAVGFSWLLWRFRHQKTVWKTCIVMCLPICLAMVIMGKPLLHRIESMLNPQANQIRIEAWKIGTKAFADKPWLGFGPDTYSLAFRQHKTIDYTRLQDAHTIAAHAHNDFLQAAVTSGLIGLACFIWLVIVYIRQSPHTPSECGLFAAGIGLLTYSQFNFSTVTTTCLMGLFSALLVSQKSLWMKFDSGYRKKTAIVVFTIVLCGLTFLSVRYVNAWRADLAYKKGLASQKLTRQIAYFKTASRLNPAVFEYGAILGNRLRDAARKQNDATLRKQYLIQAVECFSNNLKVHPQDPVSMSNLGVALMWMTQMTNDNHLKDAKHLFEKATRFDPNFPEHRAHLARVTHFTGDIEREVNHWRKVLEIQPDHQSARKILSRMGLLEKTPNEAEKTKGGGK